LNVWIADWPSTSRNAVMVYIPGGGNFARDEADAVFDGESLARHGVVLVTINYRLGPFGFYSHPALTRESPHRASGNQGIQDQIAALIWVRDNISKFGGDPSNVTIFGESAGSLDVSVLMTSPLSKGLFRRVIGESGAVILIGEPSSLSDAERRGEVLAARWKAPANAAASDLRAINARSIWDAEPDRLLGGQREMLNSFPNLGVTVDGYVLPKKPAEVFAKGQQHRVDLLLGNNAREGGPAESPSDLAGAISSMYGPLAEQAKKLYIGAPDPSYGTAADQLGDRHDVQVQRCPTADMARRGRKHSLRIRVRPRAAGPRERWRDACVGASARVWDDRHGRRVWIRTARSWNWLPLMRNFRRRCSGTGPISRRPATRIVVNYRSGRSLIRRRGDTFNSLMPVQLPNRVCDVPIATSLSRT